MYVCLYKEWAIKSSPSTATFNDLLCFPLLINPLLIPHLEWRVYTWPVLRCYKQGIKSFIRQFCMGGCEHRTWAREAEKSPILEAAARERLVKTQQARKRLSRCCDDLWVVEISGGAVIACSSESCVCKWSTNPFTNPNPVYSHTHYVIIWNGNDLGRNRCGLIEVICQYFVGITEKNHDEPQITWWYERYSKRTHDEQVQSFAATLSCSIRRH
jgi:hypothetical protein